MRVPPLGPEPDDPTQMSVRMGAFDGDPGVRPSWRTYVADAAVWAPLPDDGLERFNEGKPPFEFTTAPAEPQYGSRVPPRAFKPRFPP